MTADARLESLRVLPHGDDPGRLHRRAGVRAASQSVHAARTELDGGC
ncbi:hypothetical protein [Lysobacter gummosus]